MPTELCGWVRICVHQWIPHTNTLYMLKTDTNYTTLPVHTIHTSINQIFVGKTRQEDLLFRDLPGRCHSSNDTNVQSTQLLITQVRGHRH